MKDDELETVEHLHGKSPDKNIERKEWRGFSWINGYLIRIYESFKKKGERAGKTRATWGRMKRIPLRKLRIDLANVENDRIHLKRSTPVGKELTWQPQWSRRITTPIEIWEHHLEKVWNQHLTLKQLKYHNSKQNKGVACRNKPEQIHMIEIYPIPYQASIGKIF